MSACGRRRMPSKVHRLPLPLRAAAMLVGLLGASAPAQAQAQWSRGVAQPALGPLTALSADWLQLGAGGLDRDAAQSWAFTAAHDLPNGVRLEVGYLRAARASTTAKGVTGGASMSFTRGRVTVRPGVATMVGAAIATVQGAGYDWQSADPDDTTTGHQQQPLRARGTTVGGSLGLGTEIRLVPALALNASLRQWLFSGPVIRANRTPMLAGLGLSVYPGAVMHAAHTTTSETDR